MTELQQTIIDHLTDPGWLKARVIGPSAFRLQEILKSYEYRDDEAAPEDHRDTIEFYPQKGIELTHGELIKSSNWPYQSTRQDIYLLADGQFARVEFRWTNMSFKSSMITDAVSRSAGSTMEILAEEEIKKIQEKLIEAILGILPK